MGTSTQERVLVVDDNTIFRETLGQWLRAYGYEIRPADRGERAFLRLWDWSRPTDGLYARAALPGLIDGWILADEYHDAHPDRAVVLAAAEARNSARGDIILKQPTPTGALEAIRNLIEARASGRASSVRLGRSAARRLMFRGCNGPPHLSS